MLHITFQIWSGKLWVCQVKSKQIAFSVFFLFPFAFFISLPVLLEGVEASDLCHHLAALDSALHRLRMRGFHGQTHRSRRHVPHAVGGTWTRVGSRGSFISYRVENSRLKREPYARTHGKRDIWLVSHSFPTPGQQHQYNSQKTSKAFNVNFTKNYVNGR